MIKLIICFIILRIYFNTREIEEYNVSIRRELRLIRQELEELVISIYSIKINIGILKQELEINKDIYNAIIKLQDYNKLDNCNIGTYFNKSRYENIN